MAGAIDELSIFDGVRPTRSGDLALESQGIAPIPADARYGAVWRMFTVWFTPNMELSGVFAGTLAVLLGLGFWPGLVAIVLGTVIGSVPVALLCTWGPQTGTGQVPLARLPFGKTIVLPAAVQWLSSIGWDALVGLFGGEAAALLLGIPFWAGAALVLAIEGLVSVYGYEFVHRLQSWGSGILIILFVVLTVRIFGQHIVLPVDTVHGGALAGAFVVMMTIALSQGISWATYAVTDGLADGLAKVWAGSCCQNGATQCSRVVRCHGREGIGGFAAEDVLRVGRSASAGGKANEAGSAHRSGIAAYLAAHGLVGRGVEAAGYAEDGHGRVRTAVAPSHRHPRQVALAAIFHALLPPSRPS